MFNRIIGILVIIALVILLLPFLVGRHGATFNAQMIQAPAFPTLQTQREAIQALGDPISSSTAVLSDASSVSIKYKIKNHAKSNAWIVQIGSFKDKLNALHLVNELRARGYNAFIYQKGAALGEQVTVYIGPELKRHSAETLALKLFRETKLSTTVKSYKPLTA